MLGPGTAEKSELQCQRARQPPHLDGRGPSTTLGATDVARPGDLDAQHSHFIMVDNDDAPGMRSRFERYVSDFDISGDEIQTPKLLLVVGGDEETFKAIHASLDPRDKSTGASIPVLVLADTGGCAEDIYRYIFGYEGRKTGWNTP